MDYYYFEENYDINQNLKQFGNFSKELKQRI